MNCFAWSKLPGCTNLKQQCVLEEKKALSTEVCHNSLLNKEWFDSYMESYPIPSEIPTMLYPSDASKSSNSPSTSEYVTEETLEPVNSIETL